MPPLPVFPADPAEPLTLIFPGLAADALTTVFPADERDLTIAIFPGLDELLDGVTILEARKKSNDPAADRVTLRKKVKEKIYENAERDADGNLIDPNTRQPIKGKPDIGHKPGHEWRRTQERARREGWTREEVIEHQNNPDIYQLEDRSSNRSHRYEDSR
ncbi:HNH/ENDO VII family nuclease [Frankia sp. CiP1_Cm_nod1]|uniref:HNH/ENDO VII family nuclease n=1 Tax=Frankia sp. CiP1_Cm_nod1 TaxID=2897160 RepID=UPI002024806A